MKAHRVTLLCFLAVACLMLSAGLHWLAAEFFPAKRLTLSPAEHMTRAELWHLPPSGKERGVLVLCPGYNGSGRSLVNDREWRKYAADENLGLIGLSFASEESDLQDGTGYYYASRGSGQLLLDGVQTIYGRPLPLFLHGFSGGGHFSARLMAWKPEAVAAWCALGVGWWDPPEPGRSYPPGIIACGVEDERLEASHEFFRRGSELGLPWEWRPLAGWGHAMNPQLDAAVREFFRTQLQAVGEKTDFFQSRY